MDSEPRRDSAVIYPFPPGGRAPQRAAPKRPSTVVPILSGRGWYHDLAIRDAETTRDPKPRA